MLRTKNRQISSPSIAPLTLLLLLLLLQQFVVDGFVWKVETEMSGVPGKPRKREVLWREERDGLRPSCLLEHD